MPESSRVTAAQKYFHTETSDLTGASLDKGFNPLLSSEAGKEYLVGLRSAAISGP